MDLWNAVRRSPCSRFEPDSTAYEAWIRVKNIFQNNKGARAASLEHEFTNLRLASMPSLDAYCQRLRELAGQLKDIDAKVSNQRLVLQLVRGLPSEYDTVASFINQTLPTFETARSMLELEQHRTSCRDEPACAPVAPATPPVEPPSCPASAPASVPSQPRYNNNKRNYKGGQNYSRLFNNKASNTAGSTPTPSPVPSSWGPPQLWAAAWAPPSYPFTTYPGWAAPWPPYQPRAPSSTRSYYRSQAHSRGYNQAYSVNED